jgi:hypothetical protein
MPRGLTFGIERSAERPALGITLYVASPQYPEGGQSELRWKFPIGLLPVLIGVRSVLGEANPRGFQTFAALGDIDRDGLPLAEARQPRLFESRYLDKHVFPAIGQSDETVAPLGVEPFDRASRLDRCAGRWPVRCPRPETRSSLCHWSSSAAIDAQHLGDVRPFVSWTDAHFERFTRLHCVDPAVSEDAPMEEGVARPIGQLDESKPLFGFEPFDDCTDRRTGGCLERCSVEPGSGFESTGLWVVSVSVEIATPRMTKILISQLWFLRGCARSAPQKVWIV